MAYYTSNELTGGHGVSPISKPNSAIQIERAFLIYIRIQTMPASAAGGEKHFLYIRQFYHDYSGSSINTPEALIKAAISIGEKRNKDVGNDVEVGKTEAFSNKYVNEPAADRKPFPHIFAENFDEVNFGWKPCHVIFIFDNPDFHFIKPDAEHSLNQPVVFRKNKALQDSAGNWVEGGPYEENHSFFNLAAESTDGFSYLIMENHMKVGSEQRSIEMPSQAPYPVWHYCMDINVRVPQNRTNLLLGVEKEAAAQTTNWLTIVFDPPQNNGGGSGPPGGG
jgi:hypothetical protein